MARPARSTHAGTLLAINTAPNTAATRIALILLAVGASVHAADQVCDIVDLTQSRVEVGLRYQNPVLGDLDADGDLDLVVQNFPLQSTVIVLKNNGLGSFTEQAFVAGGTMAANLDIGDLDGDGDLDLAGPAADGSGLHVFINDGAGNFAPFVLAEAQFTTSLTSFRLADVDADGDLDAITTDFNAHEVRVLDGNGDGTFGPTDGLFQIDVYPVGFRPVELAVGDLDADGDIDIVTANRGSDHASVLLNDGSGGFLPGGDVSLDERANSIELGDLDNDGDLDVLTTAISTAGTGGSVALNNGDGTFAPRLAISPGAQGGALAALGDLNQDGVLDVILAVESGLRVRLGNGDGTFGAKIVFLAPAGSGRAALGDLNGDGDVDIVKTNFFSADASVFQNECVPTPSCGPVDFVEPFAVLDLGDIQAFIQAFVSQQSPADLAAPFGMFDLADLQAFIAGFTAGCP